MKIASTQFPVFENPIQLPITNSALIIVSTWFLDIINIENIWKSANFSGTTSNFVCGVWAPCKLWVFKFFERYLKLRHYFDIICLNFFYILDGPIFVDLHQVKFQHNCVFLRYFVNSTQTWHCERFSPKYKKQVSKVPFSLLKALSL